MCNSDAMTTISNLIDKADKETHLVLMPIDRLNLENVRYLLDDVVLIPKSSLNFDSYRVIYTPEYWENQLSRKKSINLGQFGSMALRIGIEDFEKSDLIAFLYRFDFQKIYNSTADEVNALIRSAQEFADSILDLIRFEYCRSDLPDTLPGRPGHIQSKIGTSALFALDKENGESGIIAGRYLTTVVSAGIGLDMDGVYIRRVVNFEGEVGIIVKRALEMYRNVLESNSLSQKVISLFNLFEFLGHPDGYKNMQQIKGNVLIHSSRTKEDYHKKSERIKYLTKEIEGDSQSGLRTKLVHSGIRFEDIFINFEEQKKILLELSLYCGSAIQFLIDNSHLDFSKVDLLRSDMKKKIGV